MGAAIHKSRIDNRLVGRGAAVSQVEIGFGGGRQLFDLTSYTRHIGEDTTGDLLSKGVFLDRARGSRCRFVVCRSILKSPGWHSRAASSPSWRWGSRA